MRREESNDCPTPRIAMRPTGVEFDCEPTRLELVAMAVIVAIMVALQAHGIARGYRVLPDSPAPSRIPPAHEKAPHGGADERGGMVAVLPAGMVRRPSSVNQVTQGAGAGRESFQPSLLLGASLAAGRRFDAGRAELQPK